MSATFDLTQPQLFLDDELIEQTVRLRRVVHQPRKHFANPVYSVGAPWEGTGMVYLGGVYIDPADNLWKAWYSVDAPPAYPEIRYAVCMIVSDDGVHWRRPELDVYKGHHGERTNIVLDMGRSGRTAAPVILHEPDNEAEPWVMVISVAWPAESKDYKGYILRSPDGVHWRWLRERPNGVVHGLHDRTTAMHGPDPDFPYVLIGRGKEDIGRFNLKRVAHRIAINAERAQEGEPTRVVVPDLEDDNAGQIYHAYGFPYGDAYIGMFQWYWQSDDPWGEMELITSRDTVNWQRIRPRQAFLPRSPGGSAGSAFDCQITDTALSPPVYTVQRGPVLAPPKETLWFYYWGGAAMHSHRYLSFGRSMGLAQLRVDGFCSLRADRFPGTLVTRPVIWPGGQLELNAREFTGDSNDGGLRVEVLAEDLSPIAGLTLAEADLVSGDGRLTATWRGDGKAIEPMKDRTIRLKIYLERMDLFSLRASRESAPEAGGILEGGLPPATSAGRGGRP